MTSGSAQDTVCGRGCRLKEGAGPAPKPLGLVATDAGEEPRAKYGDAAWPVREPGGQRGRGAQWEDHALLGGGGGLGNVPISEIQLFSFQHTLGHFFFSRKDRSGGFLENTLMS